MNDLELEQLLAFEPGFDPIKWQESNPTYHLCIFKLNPEQLKAWGEEATDIRKKIEAKAQESAEMTAVKLGRPSSHLI